MLQQLAGMLTHSAFVLQRGGSQIDDIMIATTADRCGWARTSTRHRRRAWRRGRRRMTLAPSRPSGSACRTSSCAAPPVRALWLLRHRFTGFSNTATVQIKSGGRAGLRWSACRMSSCAAPPVPAIMPLDTLFHLSRKTEESEQSLPIAWEQDLVVTCRHRARCTAHLAAVASHRTEHSTAKLLFSIKPRACLNVMLCWRCKGSRVMHVVVP